jgi:DNA mismatch repair protein MutL
MMARSAPMAGQTLLAPLALNITAAQAAQVETHSALLRSLGLDLEAFGPTAVLVRSLPEVLAEGEDPAEVVHLLIDLLDSGDSPVDEALEARLVRAVCKRASVKAGQSLSLPELRRLLDDLEACAVPRTCPHGRPTVIHVSLARIDQLFGR